MKFVSFFPNVLQPIISVIVNPVHLCCLRVGLIRPQSPQVPTTLTSVNVTIPGAVDPQNIERRRQIALKALSERLSKTTDSSRQNLLPKSIPMQSKHFAKHHQQMHTSGVAVVDDATAKLMASFTIPAIPLPPPPSMTVPESSTVASTTEIASTPAVLTSPNAEYQINP